MIKAISFKANTQTPAVELKDNTQEKPAEEKKGLTKNQKIGLGTALAVLAAGGIYLATRGKADGSGLVKSGQQAGADLEKNGKKIITDGGNPLVKAEEEVIIDGGNPLVKAEEEVITGGGNGPIKAEEEVITDGGNPLVKVEEEVITDGGNPLVKAEEDVVVDNGKTFQQSLENILQGEGNTPERVAKSKSGISLKNRIRNAFSGIKVRFSTNTKANKGISEIAQEIKENPIAKPKKSYNPLTSLNKRINSWIDKQADEKTDNIIKGAEKILKEGIHSEAPKVSRMQKIRNYFTEKSNKLDERIENKLIEIKLKNKQKEAEKAKQPPRTPLKETVSKWYNEQNANVRNKYNAFMEKRKAVKPSPEPTVVSTEAELRNNAEVVVDEIAKLEKKSTVGVNNTLEQEKVLLEVTDDEFDGIANV